jgi:acetylornithine aminotransferase
VPDGANLAGAVVNAALDAGFIVNAPGPRTIRLAPPLILTAEQADTFVAALPALVAAAATTLKEAK